LILIVIGLGEELFFRGWMLGFLLRWSSAPISISVTSLAFGMSHGTLSQAIAATILGIYLGVLTNHAESVRPAVTAHIANNTLLLLWASPTMSVTPIWLTIWLVLLVLLIKWSCKNTRNLK
jgi:membrane protease YdiL (CAAX protease family)